MPHNSSRPRRRSSRRPRIRRAAATLLAVTSFGAADAFAITQKRSRVVTRRDYRQVDDDISINTQEILTNSLQPQAGKLPTWLSHPRAHMYEANVSKLRDSMLKSFFTENETLKLMYAIQEASEGDRNKMAGAAEFCLILVETMEMGLQSLLAAVFHYCSCVSARERSLLMPSTSANVWDPQEHQGLESFGEDAFVIARDAANLKRLEMLAAGCLHSPRKSGRVTPDARDSENLQRLLLSESKEWRALAIRSAACLYRMRGVEKSLLRGELTPEAVQMSREALYIFAPLASRLGMHRLKNELEDTAFKLLYHRQYEAVSSLSRVRGGLHDSHDDVSTIKDSMQRVLEDVTAEVRELLRSDPDFSSMSEHVTVTARVKEPYSLWKKMLRDGTDHVLQVPDALALRIVFDAQTESDEEDVELTRAKEKALCYYVRELCTRRWKPSGDGRFKDYVENPKPNGYSSLHYTAITSRQGQDWTMEFQIRSGEMHRVAEYGLASHWDYKAQWKKEDACDNHYTDAYLQSLQEWHWQHSGAKQWDTSPAANPEPSFLSDEAEGKVRADRIRARTEQLAPYIEALSEAQSNMSLEHVFVFLSHSNDDAVHSEGKVLALPAGSCVLDALREGEKMLGLRLNWREERLLVSHNGSIASVTQKLKNGDILTVP